MITKKESTADTNNGIFVNICPEVRSKNTKSKYLKYKYLKKKAINYFFLNLVQENRIRKLINYLILNKSTVACQLIFSKTTSKFCYFSLKFEILFGRRFGFRNNHSTNHALIKLIDLIENI